MLKFVYDGMDVFYVFVDFDIYCFFDVYVECMVVLVCFQIIELVGQC